MEIIKIVNTDEIKKLYDSWQETMILSCLQGYMGEAYATDDRKAAVIIVADFCFFAGIPSIEIIKSCVWKDFAILVPQNEVWGRMIEEVYPKACKRERYATMKNQQHFDVHLLKENVSSLKTGYQIKKVDENLYHQIMSQEWSRDLCGQFTSAQEYVQRGIGFVVMKGDEVVAGASSYTIYREGIEIEIDTRKDYRRQGLARVCASRLILECLERQLYPSWDAHNQMSLQLAIQLGYVFDKSYIVYEFIKE